MKKKILILVGILFIIILIVQNEVGKKDSNLKHVKEIIPENIKNYLKKTIFVFKNQKILETKLDKQIILNKNLEKQINELPSLLGLINFKLDKNVINFKFSNKNFELKKFKTKSLNISKNKSAKGTSYLEIFKDKLILVNANGIFSFIEKKDLDKDAFNSKIINTNIKEIIKYEEFFLNTRFGVKDVLIDNTNIYISFSNQTKNSCYNTSIIFAKMNLDYLEFKNFFTPNQCIKSENEYGEFSAFHAGGRMINNGNDIIFSNGEYRFRTHAQNPKNIFGKILKINKKTRDTKILAMGIRNTQGLSYDNKNDLLFMSEHGPKGGDEINIKKNLYSDIVNFGWPISSYGEHYPHNTEKRTKSIYKFAPLYKSHAQYGFEEPIIYYKNAIGPSEIIFLEKKFLPNENFINLLFGSMGNDPKNEGQMSLHFLSLNKKNQIKQNEVFSINERVRDLIYDKENNQVILFLETTSSIGVLR